MTLLAGLLVETGRYDEALALATKAKAIWLKALGPDHWRTASAEATEGGALAGLKQYAKAEQLLLASHEVLEKDRATGHIYQINSSRWLNKLYQATGQPQKAAQYRLAQH